MVSEESRTTPSVGVRDENENKEDELDPLAGGRERLAMAERHHGFRLMQYLRRCRQWKDRCMICRLLHDNGTSFRHTLDQCRRQDKFRFFDAKKGFTRGGTRPEGWMREWTACWGCYQPPHICGEWDVSTGAQGCEFRDIVLPTAFAVFRMTESQRWGMSLAEFSEQVGGFEDERSSVPNRSDIYLQTRSEGA